MFKYYAIAASLILAVVGVSKIKPSIKIENLPEEALVPEPIPYEQVNRVVINCDQTCTKAEREKLPNLVSKLEAIEASKCFTDYLRNGKLDLKQGKGLTLQQIIDTVTLDKVNTTLTYYYQGRNWFTKTLVIGYENGDGKIHANRAAWVSLTDCEKVANMAHEITHGYPMQFTHDFKNTARRPYSVPYMVGSAISACCY